MFATKPQWGQTLGSSSAPPLTPIHMASHSSIFMQKYTMHTQHPHAHMLSCCSATQLFCTHLLSDPRYERLASIFSFNTTSERFCPPPPDPMAEIIS